jgi:hypothetical protein
VSAGDHFDVSCPALLFQHVENVARGTVAEQLPKGLLVVRDLMPLDQGGEILWSVTSQRGLGEVRIRGQKVFRLAMYVGEITAAATGDEYFPAGPGRALENGNSALSAAGLDRTHQTGGTATED